MVFTNPIPEIKNWGDLWETDFTKDWILPESYHLFTILQERSDAPICKDGSKKKELSEFLILHVNSGPLPTTSEEQLINDLLGFELIYYEPTDQSIICQFCRGPLAEEEQEYHQSCWEAIEEYRIYYGFIIDYYLVCPSCFQLKESTKIICCEKCFDSIENQGIDDLDDLMIDYKEAQYFIRDKAEEIKDE